jgi:hypothetical protein
LRARRLFAASGLLAVGLAAAAVSVGDLAKTLGVLCALAVPLALSVAALLDAARRPAWVWALAGRARVLWMALVLVGVIALPLGLVVSSWYLLRVRPELRATENGRIRDR